MEEKVMKINKRKPFLQRVNSHPVLTYMGVFCIYVLFVCVSNWSLLIGENLMKYDIWMAEYPAQVIMSDALANGTIPIWNPLMRYGTPYYSFLGTPVWYPVTLFLALIGYTPATISICYMLHVAIGGFGMFLLAKQEIVGERKFSLPSLAGSVTAGLLYCGCGVFLANAEHIMIIISAAWVPYIFFFVRSYCRRKKAVYGMAAGACAGMILMGGYPEIFLNLFLFLIPYTLYFCYDREKTVLSNIVLAAFRYMRVCIYTVLAAAIVLLPFLNNMGLITRGNGLGQIPDGYSLSIFLSMLFPNVSQVLQNVERSMVDFYMGILSVLLLPMAFFLRNKNKKLYVPLAGGAFLLCLGSGSFLHSLLYRFCPMYDSFRFATLNRIFMILFLLLPLAASIQVLLEGRLEQKSILLGKILLCVSALLGMILTMVGNLGIAYVSLNQEKCLLMADSAFITTAVVAVYLFVFYGVKNKHLTGNLLCATLVGCVCVELLTFSFEEMPYSSTWYPPTEYGYNQNVRNSIDGEFSQNEERNRSTNFAGNKRSVSGLNSQSIAFQKTFDEEGYQSFLLERTANFSATYLRSIMEQNPEVYFTNNVVGSGDVDYAEWVNACDTPPEQIYVEQESGKAGSCAQRFTPEVLEESDLTITSAENEITVEGPFGAGETATGHLRLFYEESTGDSIALRLIFCDSDGNQQQYQGEFALYGGEDGRYAEVYFPDIQKEYLSLKVAVETPETAETEAPAAAKLVVTERLAQDEYVDVKDFGFNSIGMTVEAPTEGYVVVLQAIHEGWNLWVDGEEAEIVMVNETFMGVHVEAGTHTIIMRFRPKEFFLGAGITVVYFVVFIVLIVLFIRKRKRAAAKERKEPVIDKKIRL